jgi:tetratricopeptide (TPR) repeat protein
VSSPFMSLLAASLTLAACAAVGVPATSDPAQTLRNASALFDQQDRPFPAERMIREALQRYQANGDQLGIAEAYRTYAFFFRSPSVGGKGSDFYRKNGFLDPSATFDTRYAKSVEYFERARQIFVAHHRLDALTNVDLNLGFTHELMGDRQAACQAFNRSLQDNTEHLRQRPDARIELPRGFATYEDFVATHKKRLGCS